MLLILNHFFVSSKCALKVMGAIAAFKTEFHVRGTTEFGSY